MTPAERMMAPLERMELAIRRVITQPHETLDVHMWFKALADELAKMQAETKEVDDA